MQGDSRDYSNTDSGHLFLSRLIDSTYCVYDQ